LHALPRKASNRNLKTLLSTLKNLLLNSTFKGEERRKREREREREKERERERERERDTYGESNRLAQVEPAHFFRQVWSQLPPSCPAQRDMLRHRQTHLLHLRE